MAKAMIRAPKRKSLAAAKAAALRSVRGGPAKRGGQDRGDTPIIGIGASAGGLEAIEQFLRHVPDRCGLAFIVVQHLDPTRKGMLTELLQRVTPTKVLQVRDRLKVEPDCVYVIPPNKDLSVLRGVLHLLPPVAPRGLRLPIDYFFRSLAADQQSRSVGVILSGMGSDGTLGLAAIKERAGAVFVQAPASAKFDAMPRSAIDAGLADVVAPAEELPVRIVAHLAHIPMIQAPKLVLTSMTQSSIEKICVLLRSQTGHDFSQYKTSTIFRRIERRMGLHKLDGIASYVGLLQESPQETALLFKELLIGVTSFFRDSAVWEHLAKQALPGLLSERPAGTVLRAWVAGCSTGEEAYSLAMVFKEVMERMRPPRTLSLQIFATDLDRDAIERARRGSYPPDIAKDVSTERLSRFFVKEEHGYRVQQALREMVVFATQNVIMDPPFTKIDILACRNLLIYLSPELQKKLLPLFHYSLNPGGILFLGSAETLGVVEESFEPKGSKTRIYRRVANSAKTAPVEFPAAFRARPTTLDAKAGPRAPIADIDTVANQLLLERFSPAAVLTNTQGDILYISGRTGKYLEPAAGRANWNIHAMAREGLRKDLSTAFHRALRDSQAVRLNSVNLANSGAGQIVDVTVEALQGPQPLRGMVMITFVDAMVSATAKSPGNRKGKGKPDSVAMTRLAQELSQARENLVSTRVEMHTAQEEFKSANEELQSANEELQSTNEELTTSREEMQSMNEELQTVNHELQAKLLELSHANNDMRNLLDSTDIATLFLDESLNVRRFTPRMAKIVNLIPGDVGRPITDLTSNLVYPELATDARRVLQTLVFKETAVKTVDDHWFSVRVMPYRTLENRIDGVVITFTDITVAKTLEATLRQSRTE